MELPTYDEMKNGLLALIREGKISQEDAARICPELAKSEDERVRKEIISALKFANDDGVYDKHIAWLEKQKEHQETCTKFLAKILKHSAEGFRNVLKKKGIDYIPHESFWTSTAGTFSKQECNEFYKWMDDMTMELVTEETPEYKKGFKDGLGASKKEQKPVEWSEEDKKKLSDWLFNVVSLSLMDGKREINEEKIDKYIERCLPTGIEVIEEIFRSISPQPKVEWSEEDEATLNAAIYWINRRLSLEKANDISTDSCPLSMRETIEKLKSLRPTWKPSDEQMEALRETIDFAPDTFKPKCTLESLYEQLKRLKG